MQRHADPLWELEERFWRDGAEVYERNLAPGALMVLPPPAGVLDRQATIDAIRSAPRWRHAALQERQQAHWEHAAALTYLARANRGEEDAAYVARCSSFYVREGDRWLLALHQQTPVEAA